MLVDLHMHTEYSMDAQSPQSPLAKARAALDRGLGIIAITDHLDFYHRHGPAENRDIEGCVQAVRAAKEAFAGRLELLAGIELGQVHADPAADAFLRTHAFDLVIGSLHVMPNDLDIYFHDFASLDCDAFLREYFAQVLAMERHGGFDVLAHLDYPLRVMRREGYTPSFDQYMDRISDVLRECVSRGYALELNAAGLDGWQKKVGPPDCVLYEYRRLGGRRISIGSDSHKLSNVGRGVEECAALAKRFGFDSVTVFRGRRPEQVPL